MKKLYIVLAIVSIALSGCASRNEAVPCIVSSPVRGPIGAADEYAAAAFPFETYGATIVKTPGYKQ